MERLKGGHILLDALPEVQRSLGKNVRVVFAGDGAERRNWERRAERLRPHSDIEIEFVGWVDRARIDRLLDHSDLMVIPSLWPEPFGLTGPEAGLRGVPAVAFDVGGIPTWLIDGVNGYLAPADPPTAGGLANAIVRCLEDEDTHARLRNGAARVAGQFNLENHLTNLMEVFNSVLTGAKLADPRPATSLA
jgi:glycosyltransferase involved in cell wall biosynthesis